MRLATMYLLDWCGHIIGVRFCEYYSWEWMTLVETGWITHTTDEVLLADPQTSLPALP